MVRLWWIGQNGSSRRRGRRWPGSVRSVGHQCDRTRRPRALSSSIRAWGARVMPREIRGFDPREVVGAAAPGCRGRGALAWILAGVAPLIGAAVACALVFADRTAIAYPTGEPERPRFEADGV